MLSLYQEQPPNMMLYRPAPWLPASPPHGLWTPASPTHFSPALAHLLTRHRLRGSENLHSAFKGHTTHRQGAKTAAQRELHGSSSWVGGPVPSLPHSPHHCLLLPCVASGAGRRHQPCCMQCPKPEHHPVPAEYLVISPVLPACHVQKAASEDRQATREVWVWWHSGVRKTSPVKTLSLWRNPRVGGPGLFACMSLLVSVDCAVLVS